MLNLLKSLLGRASALLSPRVMIGAVALLLAAIGVQQLRYQGLELVYQTHLTADEQAGRQAAQREVRLRTEFSARLDEAKAQAERAQAILRAENTRLLTHSRSIPDAKQPMAESLRAYVNGRLFRQPVTPSAAVPTRAAVVAHTGAPAGRAAAQGHNQRRCDASVRCLRDLGRGGLVQARSNTSRTGGVQ